MLMAQRILNIDGIGAGRRRMEQYNEDMVAHVLDFGDAPGAGKRSHIPDVSSAVDKEVGRITMYLIMRRPRAIIKFRNIYIPP